MARRVAPASELGPGDRKFVEIDGFELTLLNVDGEYYALQNYCPHMEGPVGRGPIGRDDDGRPTIECPFHGWTFDLDTGDVCFDSKKRVNTYDVEVVDGDLVVDV